MPTIFTRIINGELPGHFLWRDEICVAFLSINPISDGHALVVPVEEVDHWLDLSGDQIAHMSVVAKAVGEAQMAVFGPPRVGQMIAGFEVPHTHIHVLPIANLGDLSFANAASVVDHDDLAEMAAQLRAELTAAGHTDQVAEI